MAEVERFDFEFDPRYERVLGMLGVRPENAHVDVDGQAVHVRFGPWRVRTPRSNVIDTQAGGPFNVWKVIGPHVSAADLGLTLGSSTERGVCFRLRVPVRGMEPFGLVRHPGVTVTVADTEGLVRALRG